MNLRVWKRALGWLLMAALLSGCRTEGKPALQVPLAIAPAAENETSRYVPTGQLLSPAGRQIDLPKIRPQGLALSPNGKLLAVSGNGEVLTLLDPATGPTFQTISLTLIPPEVLAHKRTNTEADAI